MTDLELPLAKAEPAPSPQMPPAPATRAEGLLRRLENGWLHLDRLIQKFIPPALNPFGQLGAIANTCLIIAVVSGIVLLFWYSPSVHHAYDSLEKIKTTSWLGQLMRSLHRYSSDGCLFFILPHALRITFQRRFTGARWLAWTTGILILALLWFIGWTGYWLVWDVRAQHAALGTARFIDRLPIFAEPLSRSFLTDQSVPSLLFCLIFFVHMLAPLAVGVGIWMHLMRVNRSKFLTGRAMTLWIAGSLLLLSALLPAFSASPAQMTVKAQQFSIDWWYLWPLALTDRLGGGALWAFFLVTGSAALTVPCVGWISAVMLERALQRGAGGVLVVGCGEGDSVGREGMKWFAQRMEGRREPKFDPGKADPARVRFVKFDRTRRSELLRAAREFQQQPDAQPAAQRRTLVLQIAAVLALVAVLGAVTFAFSNLPYRTPHSPEPELVVSFNHHGAILEPRKQTKEELAKRLPHMRAQVNVTRERVPVRLRVQVDGRTVLDRAYPAKGLSHDGPSMAVARLPMTPGPHQVRVELADTADPDKWTQQWTETVEFKESRASVVLFDTKAGFTLH